MARNTANLQYVHLNIFITANEGDYRYSDPKGELNFEISMPVAMFDKGKCASLIETQINAAQVLLQAEKARLAEEERAKAEQGEGE